MADDLSKAGDGFLINITISGKTTSQKVEGTSLSIGRLEECDLPLRLETLSRKHATISYRDGVFYLEDHGSANGTFINGLRVTPNTRIPFNTTDEIVMGQEAVRFTVGVITDSSSLSLETEQKPPENTSPLTSTSSPSTATSAIPVTHHTGTSTRRPTTAVAAPQTSTPPAPVDPNSPKTGENIILEAQKKAAAILHKAETEAENRTKDVYRRAQEKLDKAEETYQRRINDTYKEVEDIYQKAQTDSQASLKEARAKAEEIREQNEEYVADLRRRTEQSCEELLAGAQKSAREMKEQRLKDAEEQIVKKTEELTKASRVEGEVLITRLQKAWEDELVRREEEFTRTQKTKIEKAEKEIQAAQKSIDELTRRVTELNQEVSQKQAKITETAAALDKNHKEVKLLQSQIEKSNIEISAQKNKHQELKTDIQKLTKDSELADNKARAASDNLKKVETDTINAKKILSENTKAAETKLAAVKEEAAKTDLLVKQNLEQMNQLKASIAKGQDELKVLRQSINSSKTESNNLNTETTALRGTLKRIDDERAQADAKLKSTQAEYTGLRDQVSHVTDNLQKVKNDFDTQVLGMREKFESDKERFTKQEKDYFEQLKLDTMQNVRKYEMELLTELANNRKRLSGELTVNVEAHIKENLSVLDSKKIQEVIDRTLRENLAGHAQTDANKGEKTSLVRLKKREQYRVASASAAVGALLFYGVHFAYETIRQEASPMQRRVAAIQDEQREDLEKRKFNPPQTRDYKLTYLDNVIYTDKFVAVYEDDKFQKQFLKALTTYMFKTWRIDEEKVISLLSTSTTLVKTLAEKKEAINPNFVPQGIEKMRAVENENIQKMSDFLGSKVRYESFKKFEKQFYENYSVQ